jgi:MtN3 and saliva related transmembrane protein
VNAADVLGPAALFAGVGMALAPALQARRMLRTRSSRDFSLGYPMVLCAGFVVWLAYGVSLSNLPMALSNTASLVFMLTTIVVAVYLRRSEAAAPAG